MPSRSYKGEVVSELFLEIIEKNVMLKLKQVGLFSTNLTRYKHVCKFVQGASRK